MSRWIEVCGTEDVDREDVVPVEIDGHDYAIYRSPDDTYYATDGLCTHEETLLADGLVMDHVIECPKHNGRFDYTTGAGLGAPICENLVVYPVRIDAGKVFVELG